MENGSHCFGQLMYFCSPLVLATPWSNLIIENILNLLTELCFIKHKGIFIHKCSFSNKTAEGFLSYSLGFCFFFFLRDVLLNTQPFSEYYGHCFFYPREHFLFFKW